MLLGYAITCANKNQNGTIVRIGGEGWSLGSHEAIQQLIAKQVTIYISIGDASYYIGVRGEGQDTYLVLEPDGKRLDDVTELRSC